MTYGKVYRTIRGYGIVPSHCLKKKKKSLSHHVENTKHFLQELGQNDPICSALVNVSSLGNIEENPLSTALVISTVSYLCFPPVVSGLFCGWFVCSCRFVSWVLLTAPFLDTLCREIHSVSVLQSLSGCWEAARCVPQVGRLLDSDRKTTDQVARLQQLGTGRCAWGGTDASARYRLPELVRVHLWSVPCI